MLLFKNAPRRRLLAITAGVLVVVASALGVNQVTAQSPEEPEPGAPTPLTVTNVVRSLNAEWGVRESTIRRANSDGGPVDVWTATGSSNLCLLAQYATGEFQFQCGSIADANRGRRWLQRIDAQAGTAKHIGFAPPGTSVRLNGAPRAVDRQSYVLDLKTGDEVTVTTDRGTEEIPVPRPPR